MILLLIVVLVVRSIIVQFCCQIVDKKQIKELQIGDQYKSGWSS